MDRWFEAYVAWPPINQMVFSIIVLFTGLIVLFMFGIWAIQFSYYLAVWLRGWPDDEKKPRVKVTSPGTVKKARVREEMVETLTLVRKALGPLLERRPAPPPAQVKGPAQVKVPALKPPPVPPPPPAPPPPEAVPVTVQSTAPAVESNGTTNVGCPDMH